jgi:hypothetical protein
MLSQYFLKVLSGPERDNYDRRRRRRLDDREGEKRREESEREARRTQAEREEAVSTLTYH